MKRFLLFWFMLLALSFGFLNLSFNHGTLSLEPGTCACLYAAVPNAVNYQGRYREYGQPVTGPRTMHFYIYNTATGLGNGSGANGSLWDMGFGDNTSNNPQVWVSSGIFNVVLTPNVDLRNQPLYLEMQVIPAGSNSYKTFAPRDQLTSNWYALHAMSAEGISASSGTINFVIGSSTPMVITSNGNVGVGTTSPQATLHLAQGGILFPDNSYLTSASSVTGSGGVWTTSGGNVYRQAGYVGVDTSSPDQALSVTGNIDLTGVVISSMSTGNNYFAGNVGIGAASPAQKLDVEGNAYFSGNVGIGIPNPAAILNVNAGTATGSNNGNGVTILAQNGGPSNTTTGGAVMIAGGSGAGTGAGNGGALMLEGGQGSGTGAGGMINLAAGGASTITSGATGGGVMISAGSGYNGGFVSIGSGSGNSGGTTGSITMTAGSAPTPALTVSASNSVGIGTTNPSGKLSVQGTGASYGLFVSTDSAGSVGNLVVTNSGKVGIGTTNPVSAMDINASVNFHVQSTGSQLISGLGVWYPPSGMYNFVCDNGIYFEIDLSGTWASAPSGNNAGTCICDGVNMKFYNGNGSAATVYWQKF